jgi:hypothetical protein
MNLIPVFRSWQRKLDFASRGAGPRVKRGSYVVYRTLLAQFEGELSILCRSAMSFFWRGAGRLLSVGNADTGQGDPGRRIARRKSIDQALSDFVGDRDRFNICRLNISKRPGICPAFSASTVQCPGRHQNARLGGCSDRSGVDPFMLPRPEFEREYDQRNAKNQCVCSQPPGEYNGSDQRRDNKQHAIGERQ